MACSGTGYIGSFTTLALLQHGYNVVIIDSLYNSSEVAVDRIELICGKRPIFHKGDVTNEDDLDKVFAAHPEIDSVIHFAALKVNPFAWVPGPRTPPYLARLQQTDNGLRLSASRVRSPWSTTVST